MTTTAKRLQSLIDMAEAVKWPVELGGHYAKIRVPGRAMPVAVPGTPSDTRAVINLDRLLKRCGLHQAYDELLSKREIERRDTLTRVRTQADKKIADAVAAAAGSSSLAELAAAGAAKGMTIGFERIDPETALGLITKAQAAIADGGFRQRNATQRIIDEYALLMKHGRWMEYLPDGLIGVDRDGILINGQKRMMAVIAAGVTVGFVVARNVPREMFPHFDRAQTRTAAHTFEIDGLPSGPDYSSTIKLAMRFEEMLRGVRDPSTWGSWNSVRDPNDEALDFYRRHTDIPESVVAGRSLFYGAKLVPAAGAVFHYYASKAWPDRPNDKEGYDPLDTFISRVHTGEHMARNAPAKVLRDWSRDTYRGETIRSKREVHLFLLLRHWGMHAAGQTVPGARVQYQPTWSMPAPYNPEGDRAAIANILKG